MNKSLRDTLVFDGLKATNINALPPEAWTYLTGGEEEGAIKQLYGAVPWLYRGIVYRASGVSSVPFRIYKGENEIDVSEDYKNACGFLPDPFDLFYRTEGSLCLHGSSYWLKNTNLMARPLPEGPRWLAPQTVRPIIDKELGLRRFDRNVGGKQVSLELKDIIYFWVPDLWAELGPGTPPAAAALIAAGVLKASDEFLTNFFKRGAVKATILSVEGEPAQTERDRIVAWWRRVFSGVRNAWATDVVNATVKPQVIGEGLSELGNASLTKEKREDIATALGVPQSILFSTGGVNRAIAYQDDESFYTKTIIPQVDLMERNVNRQFLHPLGYSIEFDPQEMTVFQEDEWERSSALLNLVQAGEELDNAYDILGYDLPNEVLERRQMEAEAEVERQQSRFEVEELEDVMRMRRKAMKRLRSNGRAAIEFRSSAIRPTLLAAMHGGLEQATSADEVDAVLGGIPRVRSRSEDDERLVSLLTELLKALPSQQASGGPGLTLSLPQATVFANDADAIKSAVMAAMEAQRPPEVKVENVVNVPEQPAPLVEVQVPETKQAAPIINVNVEPTPVRVENRIDLPKRTTETQRVTRDQRGLITKIEGESVSE